jgi:hypothetical protein
VVPELEGVLMPSWVQGLDLHAAGLLQAGKVLLSYSLQCRQQGARVGAVTGGAQQWASLPWESPRAQSLPCHWL